MLHYEPRAARLSIASADRVLRALRRRDLELTYVLETHAHADHLSAASYLHRKTGAKVVIGAEITRVQKTFIPLFEAADLRRPQRPARWTRRAPVGDHGRTSLKIPATQEGDAS